MQPDRSDLVQKASNFTLLREKKHLKHELAFVLNHVYEPLTLILTMTQRHYCNC